MNKKFRILFAALIAVVGLGFTACDSDDDAPVAKAVLASIANLNFDGEDSASQEIAIYSDATWHVEAPDWVTVEPATGSGTTDVTITVASNMRDGELDNPRKANVVFKGNTKASEAIVVVSQTGNPFRGVVPISIEAMEQEGDERVVIVENVTVVAPTNNGFVGTDGNNNIYVKTALSVPAVGTALTVNGTKWFDANKMSYVEATSLEEKGTAAEVPAATDITDQLDSYRSTTRAMISVEGIYDGSNVTVEGQSNVIVVDDSAVGVDIKTMNGHKVRLTGLYGGTATPAVTIILTKMEDLGLFENIFYMEDFEWLNDWAVGAGAGRTVETDDVSAAAPALTSVKSEDGTTCFDFIESKGYTFIYDKDDKKRIYLQQNYLKFGKTGNHAGIILPSVDVPEGTKVYFEFQWCPMRQGSGKIDPVTLFVDIDNGGDVKRIDVPTHEWANDHKLEWITCRLDLSDYQVDKNTKITISQNEFDESTANRYFLDNLKIAEIKK